MRPMTVRFSHSNRGASRRRSNFVAAPVKKQAAPTMTLVEKAALSKPSSAQVVKAA
ncbi:hypothetical protein [Vibrio maerlii]|uniref:hypothetical protein n=1 Tax=Vibrio maerlii TaxID=2231648 RepID=UPI0013DEA5B8|nr:hypothetical protein [Vibrio maerlii]